MSHRKYKLKNFIPTLQKFFSFERYQKKLFNFSLAANTRWGHDQKKCKKNSRKCVYVKHFSLFVRSYHKQPPHYHLPFFFEMLSYVLYFYFSHSYRHRISLFTLFSFPLLFFDHERLRKSDDIGKLFNKSGERM
jgi:hypothetical protein